VLRSFHGSKLYVDTSLGHAQYAVSRVGDTGDDEACQCVFDQGATFRPCGLLDLRCVSHDHECMSHWDDGLSGVHRNKLLCERNDRRCVYDLKAFYDMFGIILYFTTC